MPREETMVAPSTSPCPPRLHRSRPRRRRLGIEAGPGTGRFHPRRVHSLDFGEATTTMAWHGDPAMASLSITPGAALASGLHADDAVTVHGHRT